MDTTARAMPRGGKSTWWLAGEHNRPQGCREAFEIRDDAWFCIPCNQYATEGHCGTGKHQWNLAEFTKVRSLQKYPSPTQASFC